MMIPVFYNNNQGSGYLTESENVQDLNQDSKIVANEILMPGMMSDLSGYFCRKLKYLGCKGRNELIFLIGSKSDLFKKTVYLQSVFLIQTDRIYEQFSHNAGRDHYFIKNEWK